MSPKCSRWNERERERESWNIRRASESSHAIEHVIRTSKSEAPATIKHKRGGFSPLRDKAARRRLQKVSFVVYKSSSIALPNPEANGCAAATSLFI